MFYENIAITDKCLEKSLEAFSQEYVHPAMRHLAKRLGTTPLGDEFMELPFGLDDVANERFDFAMRCAISSTWPLRGQTGMWSRIMKYYDVETDQFETGPCGIGVAFTVHEPGMESALRIPVVDAAFSQ